MTPGAEAFFLPAPGGQRLCMYHAPPVGVPAARAIVYLHPLAEEMNKSRRMAALASRQLAGAGHAVLQIDLLGCGDSSGDFGDASWDAWVDDALLAARWLQARHPRSRLTWWGLRAGALLASAAAASQGEPADFLFWHPASSGKTLLQQFLRLRLASELQQVDNPGRGAVERLRGELAAGRCIDIAGYTLSPGLALELDKATLAPPTTARPGQVHWLELSTRDPAALLPASGACIEAWRGAGFDLHASAVGSPTFWQTQEIEDAPALIAATLAAAAMQAEPQVA